MHNFYKGANATGETYCGSTNTYSENVSDIALLSVHLTPVCFFTNHKISHHGQKLQKYIFFNEITDGKAHQSQLPSL